MKSCTKNMTELLSRYLKRAPLLAYIHTVKSIRSLAYHMYLFQVLNKQLSGLNLGSGGNNIKEFCNIDANPWTLCDIVARIEKL